MITKESISKVLERADIVEEIGRRMPLRKAGTSMVGLCPFHGEKTPSFHVSPHRQRYHCFGCGAAGDVIEFLMQHDGMEFADAVEDLGGKLGIALTHEDASQNRAPQISHAKQDSLSDICERAAQFYNHCFKHTPEVIEYAKKRKLSQEVIDLYAIGYAPFAADGLAECFPDYDKNQQIMDAGLVGQQEGDTRRYDRFRDRLMFPIRNTKGRIIGFGGRVINDNNPKAPKYLNSPETEIFSKHKVLYGLHEGRAGIMRQKMAYVVEGYMDVVAMAMHGINNAVAAMGTALTSDHVRVLTRFSPNVCFIFDGDKAGKSAAWKSAVTVLPLLSPGLNFNFLTLPNGLDPDEYLGDHGKDAFNALVTTRAQSLSEFTFEYLKNEFGKDGELSTLESKANFLREASALCAQIPADNPLRTLMLDEVNRLSGIATQPRAAPVAALSPADRLRQRISGTSGGQAFEPKKKRVWLSDEEFKANLQSQKASGLKKPFPAWNGNAPKMAPPLPDQSLWARITDAIKLAPQKAYDVGPNITYMLNSDNQQELNLLLAFDALERLDEFCNPPNAQEDERQAACDFLDNAPIIIAKLRRRALDLHLKTLRDTGQITDEDYVSEVLKNAN